jgi:hypothetical protein
VALRVEVRRLGELVEQAVTALRSSGAIRDADRIERELGVSIDVIRAEISGAKGAWLRRRSSP